MTEIDKISQSPSTSAFRFGLFVFTLIALCSAALGLAGYLSIECFRWQINYRESLSKLAAAEGKLRELEERLAQLAAAA